MVGDSGRVQGQRHVAGLGTDRPAGGGSPEMVLQDRHQRSLGVGGGQLCMLTGRSMSTSI